MKFTYKDIIAYVIIICSVLALGYVLFNIIKDNIVIEDIHSEYDIAKIYIAGNLDDMEAKEDIRQVEVKYVSHNKRFRCFAEMELQGTASLEYDKKNYIIQLYDSKKFSKNYKVDLGFGKQSKYCIKANYIDKTQARNIVSSKLAANLQKQSGLFTDTPNYGLSDGFPVAIYLNGEFYGLYTLNIPKDEWMFNIDKDNKNVVAVETRTNDTDQVKFKEEIGDWAESGFEVEIGEYTDEVKENINRLIRFVKDSSDEEFVEHFEEYFNKDAAINYILTVYVTNALDNTAKNMILLTNDGKIWYTCLYDLDTTFGTDWDGALLDDWNCGLTVNESLLWDRVAKCFKDEIAKKYIENRNTIFTKNYIMELFEGFCMQFPDELKKQDVDKWGAFPGRELDQISEYLDYKLNILDEEFGYNQE